jgi:uncharacterized protein YdiU (UPF0061 family)
VLKTYEEHYWTKYYAMIAGKLGLDKVRDEDVQLFQEFESMLAVIQPDMTIFYQLLIDLPLDTGTEQEVVSHFHDSFYDDLSLEGRAQLHRLIHTYQNRRKANTCTEEDAKARMQSSNPRFILRNYLLHQAIEQLEKGEDSLFRKLQEAIKDPYSQRFDEFFETRPGCATEQAGCSMLSCSS